MTGQGLAIATAVLAGILLFGVALRHPHRLGCNFYTASQFLYLSSFRIFFFAFWPKCLRVPLGLDNKNEMCKHRSLRFCSRGLCQI